MDDVLTVNKLGVIEDEENYYFFRALNMADNADIENGITSDNSVTIKRIRTDRERYQDTPKYNENSQLSLEEIFDHIKMHYLKETNCISLSSNANVVSIYGRGYYKDTYAIIKVAKEELGHSVVEAGSYMMEEIEKRIDNALQNTNIDDEIKERIKELNSISSQEELDLFIEKSSNGERTQIFKNGFSFINSTYYQSLSEEENFEKNKLVAKMETLGINIIPNVSNKFLINTLGNAFSSLEYIHYKDIDGSKIIEIPKEIIDIFSLVQQLPNDYPNINDMKLELLEYLKGEKQELSEFKYKDYKLDDNEYTIEKMYELTQGDIDFYTASNVYKKSFYLAKSRLRAISSVNALKDLTENKPKYDEIYSYLNKNGYGIEPEIFSRDSKNRIVLSESVGFNFNSSEQELIDLVNSFNEENLETIIQNPLFSLKPFLRVLSYAKDDHKDKDEYYANAIVDMFDWTKLNISEIYNDQRQEIVQKLKEKDCITIYNKLKELNIEEKDIVNVLLTSIIKDKNITNIDINESFTLEELESFLGYYEIENSNLVLKDYQVSALLNIDKIFEDKNFATAILPTGAGKSFVALAEMLEHKDEDMLFLAPNNEILNQLKRYAKIYVHGKAHTSGKSDDEILKEVFPNLTVSTYANLMEDNAKSIREKKYKLIVSDELHRTGATEYYKYVKETFDNQDNTTKVLGITATPQRDMDLKDMSDIWAEYFGYSEEEIDTQKHLAVNMDILEGIKAGYIVHPKIVSCEYTVTKDGTLDNILEHIEAETDSAKKKKLETRYENLRRNLLNSDGIEKILKDNVKENGKYIVFLPITKNDNGNFETEDGIQVDKSQAERVIQAYQNQMRQYVYAGGYLEENIGQIAEIEKCINENIDFTPEMISFLNNEKDNILLLTKLDNVRDDNILVSKSNELTQRIIEKMNWKELSEQEKIEKLHEKTKNIVENYSMLGSYSDKKNKSELDNFNSSNSNKVKFMFVMNKLNEGVHVDSIDGIIWFRAMDENSKILYLQQLGRCIYGVDPNKEIKDEDRPVVIDFVNNTLKVNLEKGDIQEIKDLNLLKIINDYVERHGGIELGINSNDQLEKYYARSLKRINNKYSKYIDSATLLDELDYKRKRAVLGIINEGSNIDLWNKEFEEEIFDKNNTNNSSKSSDLYDALELNGKMRDLLDLKNEVTEGLFVSREEKKEEYIKSIRELGRNIKMKSSNGGVSERIFRDETDQRSYYDELQKKYKKIDKAKPLTQKEQEIVNDYEEIRNVLDEYEIIVTREEKKTEYIKSVRKLGRNVKEKEHNKGKSERAFRDGTDQRLYFDNLQKKYNKIDKTKSLTQKEQEIISDYEEIRSILDEYERVVTREEKKEEFIKSIRKLGRNVKKKEDKGESERTFRDGTDQRYYFDNLQNKYNKIDKTKSLTQKEQEIVSHYEEIKKVLDEYGINITREEKKEEFIRSVRELRRNVIKKGNKGGKAERIFRDGTDQRGYFDTLQTLYNRIDKTKPLTKKEQEIVCDYEEIKTVLDEYERVVTREEKKEEFIKSVRELGRNVKEKEQNKGESERAFRDGTDQRLYFDALQKKYKKIDKAKSLTQKEQEIISDYEEIRGILDECERVVTREEKKEEFIKSVRELGRNVKQKGQNKGESERAFRDGTDQRLYFDALQRSYKKIDKTKPLTQKEQEIISDYEEINFELGFISSKKYFDTYGNLNVIKGYKEPFSKYPLRDFLDMQRELFNKEEKDGLQLEHERRLTELCPSWVTSIKEETNSIDENKSYDSELNTMVNEVTSLKKENKSSQKKGLT